MANEKVVVQSGTLKFQQPAPYAGNITFLSSPSLKVKAENKGVYKGNVQFVVATGATNGVYTTLAPYTNSFSPLSTKNLIENEKPLRENDSKIITLSGNDSGGNPGTFTATVIINDCGQTKVTMG